MSLSVGDKIPDVPVEPKPGVDISAVENVLANL